MSRKPASSISRRMIPTICARRRDVPLELLAAQVEPAVAQAQRLVDALLVELERQRRRARDDLEPVDLQLDLARRHRRVDGLRRARDELALAPGSRTRCAARAPSRPRRGARSGLTTSWETPVRSRRSTKTSPPWSRRRATQPASVSRSPDVLGPRLAAHQVAPAHADSLATSSSSGRARPSAPARGASRLAADDDRRRRSESSGLGQLALERASRVVGVGGDAGAAQLGEPREHALARRAVVEREEDVDARRARRLDALLLHREQQPLDAGAEADAGRRRAADLLDEPVVAAAARDRRVLRSPSGRRTPRSCACSSRARARASARARSGRRTRRGSPAPRRSARAGLAERLADLRRLVAAPPEPRSASRGSCRTREAGSSRDFSRVVLVEPVGRARRATRCSRSR